MARSHFPENGSEPFFSAVRRCGGRSGTRAARRASAPRG
jgi:hypothetical protein